MNRKAANSFEFRMTVPDQTAEEAQSMIRDHAQALLDVKSLLESESWREAQRELRQNSAYLKQDIYTIIQSKEGSVRPLLRKLYSNLFNNVTKVSFRYWNLFVYFDMLNTLNTDKDFCIIMHKCSWIMLREIGMLNELRSFTTTLQRCSTTFYLESEYCCSIGSHFLTTITWDMHRNTEFPLKWEVMVLSKNTSLCLCLIVRCNRYLKWAFSFYPLFSILYWWICY